MHGRKAENPPARCRGKEEGLTSPCDKPISIRKISLFMRTPVMAQTPENISTTF
jgi:hypothetical protein